VGPGGLRAIIHDAATGGAEPPFVLVGLKAPDDAAVVATPAGTAVVLTADVITPACDDPFLFGQLAAANALSDVYAMGGRPLAVLNLCFFPEDDACPPDVKRRILEGVTERVQAAGAAVVGGHSVRDAELKMGLSVTGTVDPARVLRKGGLRVGDVLILTKALGIGVLINGYRRELVDSVTLEDALRVQIQLNDQAGSAAVTSGAAGCTDITGFGLCGHALEMARGAGVTLVFNVARVPMLAPSLVLAGQGVSSRGAADNEADALAHVDAATAIPAAHRALCFDPQTSGGLLFGVEGARVDGVLAQLRAHGMKDAQVVGRVEAGAARVRLEWQP